MDPHVIARRILDGGVIERTEAQAMLNVEEQDLDELLQGAFRLREHYFGRGVTLHVLRNAKSGACPEDCSFCSQSVRFESEVDRYRIESPDQLLAGARDAYSLGASRYCMVTATRAPSTRELDIICEATLRIKEEMPLEICASLGFLNQNAAERLATAGVDRFNHNLETSERHFPQVVTSHTWADRVATVHAAKAAGMAACCGGIIGMGESEEDRVDLAFSLRALEVESIPLNFLDPRPGTPMAESPRLSPGDCLRTLAMMRFVNPSSDLRIAGGREKALGAQQSRALLAANSFFTEGYLTTGGQGYESDIAMIEDAGFRVAVLMPH